MTYMFVTFGPTHSGKTTFGKRLSEAVGASAKFIHVDNDEVDEFIQAKFKNLRNDPEVIKRRSPAKPDLRLLIPQLITDFALGEGYSVIATASHPKQIIREKYYEIAQKHNARIVLIIFSISDEEANHRIERSQKSKAILDIKPLGSSTYKDLRQQQINIAEVPDTAERSTCFQIIEVNDENANAMVRKAAELLLG